MGVKGVDEMSVEEYRKAAVDAVQKLSVDVGTAIIGTQGFFVGATPYRLLTSSNSGFAMMIPIALAVSMDDPPPIKFGVTGKVTEYVNNIQDGADSQVRTYQGNGDPEHFLPVGSTVYSRSFIVACVNTLQTGKHGKGYKWNGNENTAGNLHASWLYPCHLTQQRI